MLLHYAKLAEMAGGVDSFILGSELRGLTTVRDGASSYPAVDALKSLAVIMVGFYATCAVFVFVVLGTLLKVATGVNVFKLFKYLGREFLLIVSTSSSESALPRLIAKMEHAGVERTTVGTDERRRGRSFRRPCSW